MFPAGFDRGYRLHGFGRESRKLPGLKLRKIVLADGTSYWLRPSFVTGYMTGTVEELAYPLLLAAHGVPAWLLTIGFGHSEMYWYRLIERLGRNSLVGTTVRDAARLPDAPGGRRASRRLGRPEGLRRDHRRRRLRPGRGADGLGR